MDKINFEQEFKIWLTRQKDEYLDNTSTENILKKFISTAFLAQHYVDMCYILSEHSRVSKEIK